MVPSPSAPRLGRRAALAMLAAGGAAAAGGRLAWTGEGALVAAAADLRFALEEIAGAYRRDRQASVRISFGSSGNLARQIGAGAPVELYLSADERYVFDLAGRGLTEGRGTLYALGRIVLFAPRGSPLRVDAHMSGLRAAVADGRLKRFAIANPAHAPYGRAAREALSHAGLWDAVRPFLVFGENVAQAARFAATDGVEGGIFAYSLALAPTFAGRGAFALVPASWHAPLRQRMVLVKGAGPAARKFYAYLRGPEARAVLVRYGFTLPGAE